MKRPYDMMTGQLAQDTQLPQDTPQLPKRRLGVFDDECSPDTWDQLGGQCFIAAAFILVAKVPCIRNNVKEETERFLQKRRTALSVRTCERVPAKIREIYHDEVSLTFRHSPFAEGGDEVTLFKAILMANDINFVFDIVGVELEWLRNVQKSDNLPIPCIFKEFQGFTDDYVEYFLLRRKPVSIIEEGSVKIFQFIFSDPSLMVTWGEFMKKMELSPSGKIKGGIFDMIFEEGYHAAAFTICRSKVLLCNWGRCAINNEQLLKCVMVRVALVICEG